MDKKEIAEVRRLVSPAHCQIDRIRGCYVNENKEILMEMKENFLAMEDDHAEKYLDLCKKVLTGRIGRNLFNMEFPLSEEEEGGKMRDLYALVQCDLTNDDLVHAFLEKFAACYDTSGKYLLVLVHGSYDVPARGTDRQDMEDASDYVYSFLVASVCPVKEAKDGLVYDPASMMFVDRHGDWMVQRPDLGFLYPAFNDRMPDVHGLLYYCRKEDDRHQEVSDQFLGASLPMPESHQKEIFSSIVEQTLGRSCDFESVRGVQQELREIVEAAEDDPEPVEVGKQQIRRILSDHGADDQVLEEFDTAYDEALGAGETLMAESLAPSRAIEVKAPGLKISVKGEMAPMLQTRIIDGREYLVIPVSGEIEVNGIRIVPTQKTE